LVGDIVAILGVAVSNFFPILWMKAAWGVNIHVIVSKIQESVQYLLSFIA